MNSSTKVEREGALVLVIVYEHGKENRLGDISDLAKRQWYPFTRNFP